MSAPELVVFDFDLTLASTNVGYFAGSQAGLPDA